MRKLIPLKFLSCVLIAVMFSIILGDVCGDAHAGEYVAAAGFEESARPAGSAAQCPCCPSAPAADHQGAETSCACACHASLTNQPFSVRYTPVFADLQTCEPFASLPEVFLSKFVPPQLRA